MPFSKTLFIKPRSFFATAMQRQLPGFSKINVAPVLTSIETTWSCLFLMASNNAVLPKLSERKIYQNMFLKSKISIAIMASDKYFKSASLNDY